MHLTVRLPKVQPTEIRPPTRCPPRGDGKFKKSCAGTRFKLHQIVCRKPLRDTRYSEVLCHPYRCLKCQRCFRVYPTGVSHDHPSDTLKGLSVLRLEGRPMDSTSSGSATKAATQPYQNWSQNEPEGQLAPDTPSPDFERSRIPSSMISPGANRSLH